MATRLAFIGSLAALCLTASLASAEVISVDANSDQAQIEIPLDPIVIESEALAPEPTLDQLFQNFRDVLGQPPSLLSSERRSNDGTLEVTTRLGRLCAKPLPGSTVRSGLGGDITLAAPCPAF